MVSLPADVHHVVSKNRAYFYFAPGRGSKTPGKRIRLPDDPKSPAFWTEYALLSGKPQQVELPKARGGTFNALIAAYKGSPESGRKAPGTRANEDRDLRLIAEIWGDRQVKGLRGIACAGVAR
jgi:hypothetical protein